MSARDFSERDIHLALDGELPEDERAAYEAWLEAMPDKKARAARFAADISLVRAAVANVIGETVPERLSRIVDSGSAGPTGVRPAPRWWAAAAAAVILAAGLAGGYIIGASGTLGEDPTSLRLADNAVSAYLTFDADQSHAVEVGGSDKNYLEHWLSKRTGLKLVAPDLTAQGFELLGGRILPGEESPAALLVYKDAVGNQVSIYLTAEGKAKSKGTYMADGGRPVAVYWLDKGFGCAIVSALPDERQNEVVGSAWRQIKEGLAG
jgi:anti-sigma factor RsiW